MLLPAVTDRVGSLHLSPVAAHMVPSMSPDSLRDACAVQAVGERVRALEEALSAARAERAEANVAAAQARDALHQAQQVTTREAWHVQACMHEVAELDGQAGACGSGRPPVHSWELRG